MTLPFSRIIFIATLVFAAAFIIATTGSLPERVASHFGAGGAANGFMPQSGYRQFMLVFAVGVPLAVVLLISGLPRLFPGLVNIPNRDYWLAPDQREASLDFLVRHGYLFGCLLVIFICVVHGLVLLANTHSPPRLANGPFIGALLVFLVAMGFWIGALVLRFRQVPD